ncbi:hypothetical protein PTR03_24735, partial [Serratia nevei]|uniref:hypothetical protein n=1 Tax=Serratia nevei TaxID=2703794 RepID=UPI00313E5851
NIDLATFSIRDVQDVILWAIAFNVTIAENMLPTLDMHILSDMTGGGLRSVFTVNVIEGTV